MKITLSFLAFLFVLNIHGASAQSLLSAEEVIEKAITATGGKEYLKSVKTLYSDLATVMEGRNVNWITKEMMPNKGSFIIMYQGRTVFRNFYDGEKGYEISGSEKKLADQEEFSDKKFRKNIFNELDYLDKSLYSLSLENEEKVGSEVCYKVKATCVNGTVRLLYYSKTTFYQLREDKLTSEKANFDTTYFYKYKRFGKLNYYSELTFGTGDQAQSAKLVELLVNEKVSDADFK
ncbi:hypothetical protein [Pedobacter sandarakinus]|uniref:hypothetical protein n=1 Tax=Pedobacter sandarakinus TaxID=353156 RepID=UPI002246C574|nr:hypothetical protein [Pedobacter sandarakinus]MCX2576383.1 hypothetical protein [Pedobacter sandarakinus]